MSMMSLLGKLFAPGDPRAIMTPGINGQRPPYPRPADSPMLQPDQGQGPVPMTPGFNPNASMPNPGPSPSTSMIPPRPMQPTGMAQPRPKPGSSPLVGPNSVQPVITNTAPQIDSPLAPEDEAPEPSQLVGRRLPVPQVNMQVPPRPSIVGQDLQQQMDQDYARTRDNLITMPRKADYGSKLTALGGIVGELGANMLASSPNRWLRATAPTANKVGSMVADAGYGKALQRWNEDQAVDSGLQSLSSGQAKAKVDLDRSEAQADLYRAQADLAKARPGMNSKQIALTSEQAKIYGYPQDAIDEAEASGQPLMGDVSVMRARIAEKREREKAQIRADSTERWRNKKIESDERVAKAHDDARKAMTELQEASRDWRNAMDNETKQQVQQSKASTTRSVQASRDANVDKMMNSRTAFEKAKLTALSGAVKYRQAAEVAAEKMYLSDPTNPGQVIPVDTWAKKWQDGDEEAGARVQMYYQKLKEIGSQVDQMHQAIENSTETVYQGTTTKGDKPPTNSPAKQTSVDPGNILKGWDAKWQQAWQAEVPEGKKAKGPDGKLYLKVNGLPVLQ